MPDQCWVTRNSCTALNSLVLNSPVSLLQVTFGFVGFQRIPCCQLRMFGFWPILIFSTCEVLCFQLSLLQHVSAHHWKSLAEWIPSLCTTHCCSKWQSGVHRSSSISTLLFNFPWEMKFKQWKKKRQTKTTTTTATNNAHFSPLLA